MTGTPVVQAVHLHPASYVLHLGMSLHCKQMGKRCASPGVCAAACLQPSCLLRRAVSPACPPLTTSQVPSGVSLYPDSHAVHLHTASYVLHLGTSVHCRTGQAGLATEQASAGSAAGGLARTQASGPSQACTSDTHALAAAGDGHASGAGRALALSIVRAALGDVSALPDRIGMVGHRAGVSG